MTEPIPTTTGVTSTSLSSTPTELFSKSDILDNFTSTTVDNTVPIIDVIQNKSVEVPFYLKFRDEPWVIPLVSLALLNVAVIFIFEIYVLYKSCGGKRHLFLGQILLLGLLLCSLLGLLYVPEPHWLFCGITRAGVGIAYAIVFGSLLVKCVFLLKIHEGVYFNASFQAFLLFFIVAVEVVIVAQWLVYEPARVTSSTVLGEVSTVCDKSPVERIVYLTYVMLLLFLVIVGSIRARSLRENNKEAVYIGLSIAFCLIFWVAWTSVALIFDRRYEAPAEAFGLVCTALLVFLLVFIPKAAHLASPRGNLTSHAGSHSVLHTPSFLHLQPHSVLPSSTQGTLVKQSHHNADYCRGGYSARIWRYDYPSFQQMETPAIANSEMNSLKKNGSAYNHSHLY